MPLTAALIFIGLYAAFAPILARGRQRRLSPLLAGALHVLAAVGAGAAAFRFAALIVNYLQAQVRIDDNDFAIFYAAAITARAHLPLYDLANIRLEAGEVNTYRYAPVGAALLVPLTGLSLRAALTLWQGLNVGLYVATLLALLWHFRLRPYQPLALGLIAAWFASAPTFQSLASGQWDTIFLASSALALILLARRRDGLAGACLGFPIVLKFYPVLLLLPPLLARRYRALAGCALAGLALTLVGLLVAGWANTRTFFTEVLPTTGGGTIIAPNQTPYAFVGRLLASILVDSGHAARYPVGLTTWLARGIGLLVLAASLFVIGRRDGGALGEALRFVLCIPATLLIIPTAWVHYEEWALLALFVLAVAIAESEQPARRPVAVATCFVLAVVVLTFGTETDVWTEGVHVGVVRLILTYKVYGLAALWLGCVMMVWCLRASEKPSPAPLSVPISPVRMPGRGVSENRVP